MPSYSFKCSFSLFAQAFSLAPFSKCPHRFLDSKVFVFGVRFHNFGVNGRLNQKEKYLFCLNMYWCKCHLIHTCTRVLSNLYKHRWTYTDTNFHFRHKLPFHDQLKLQNAWHHRSSQASKALKQSCQQSCWCWDGWYHEFRQWRTDADSGLPLPTSQSPSYLFWI